MHGNVAERVIQAGEINLCWAVYGPSKVDEHRPTTTDDNRFPQVVKAAHLTYVILGRCLIGSTPSEADGPGAQVTALLNLGTEL
jgi:hypothetical protein